MPQLGSKGRLKKSELYSLDRKPEPEPESVVLGEIVTIDTILVHRCGYPIQMQIDIHMEMDTARLLIFPMHMLLGKWPVHSHYLKMYTRHGRNRIYECPTCREILPNCIQDLAIGKDGQQWYGENDYLEKKRKRII